ncbi:MAG: CDP-alcohol phosphatidyltransferase family protein [Patescibacteria group bacterium]
MITTLEEQNFNEAEKLRSIANALSDIRANSSLLLGPAFLLFGPNWPLAITTAGVATTDRLDGDLARRAAQILEEPTTVEGSVKDHEADRRLTFGLLGFTAARDIVDGNLASAAIVGGVIAISSWREISMAKIRNLAEAEGKRTDAIYINKLKAAGLMTALAFGMSPLVEKPHGKAARNLGLIASTVLGVVGMYKFKNKLVDS